jgi:hypothetical protein
MTVSTNGNAFDDVLATGDKDRVRTGLGNLLCGLGRSKLRKANQKDNHQA